jgi:phospholipid N-methyltransferase
LLEIGVISPEQGMDSIRTGLFPNADTLQPAQEKYLEDREKGMYNPLIGGVPLVEAPGAEEERDLKEKQINKIAKQSSVNNAPNNQQEKPPKEVGRPTGATAKTLYSRKNLQSTVYDIEKLRSFATTKIKNKFKVKRLNKQQTETLDSLIEAVVVSNHKKDWEKQIEACIKNPEKIEQCSALPEILNVSSAHQLTDYPAAILFHSK